MSAKACHQGSIDCGGNLDCSRLSADPRDGERFYAGFERGRCRAVIALCLSVRRHAWPVQDVNGRHLLKVEPLNAILDPQYFVRAVHQCTLSVLQRRGMDAYQQASENAGFRWGSLSKPPLPSTVTSALAIPGSHYDLADSS